MDMCYVQQEYIKNVGLPTDSENEKNILTNLLNIYCEDVEKIDWMLLPHNSIMNIEPIILLSALIFPYIEKETFDDKIKELLIKITAHITFHIILQGKSGLECLTHWLENQNITCILQVDNIKKNLGELVPHIINEFSEKCYEMLGQTIYVTKIVMYLHSIVVQMWMNYGLHNPFEENYYTTKLSNMNTQIYDGNIHVVKLYVEEARKCNNIIDDSVSRIPWTMNIFTSMFIPYLIHCSQMNNGYRKYFGSIIDVVIFRNLIEHGAFFNVSGYPNTPYNILVQFQKEYVKYLNHKTMMIREVVKNTDIMNVIAEQIIFVYL